MIEFEVTSRLPLAEWNQVVERISQSQQWSSLWELVKYSSARRSRELLFILEKAHWKPPLQDDELFLLQSTELAHNWARAEQNTNADAGKVRFLPCSGTVKCFAFSPNGRFIVTSNENESYEAGCELKLWELETWKCVGTLDLNFQPSLLSFSPDNSVLAVGAYQNLLLLRFPELEIIRHLSPLAKGPVDITFSPFGNYLFACGMDESIRFWNAADNTCFSRFKITDCSGNRAECDPSGRLFASIGSVMVSLWDLHTGKPIHKFTPHPEAIRAFAFASDGQIIVTAGADDDKYNESWSVRFWSVPDCQKLGEEQVIIDQMSSSAASSLVATLGGLPIEMIPYQASQAALNPKQIVLFDSKSAGRVAGWKLGELDWCRTLEFSPDGRFLAGYGGPSGICLWSRGFGMIEGKAFVETLKDRSPAELNASEVEQVEKQYNADWLDSPDREFVQFIWNLLRYSRLRSRLIQRESLDLRSSGVSQRRCFQCNAECHASARICSMCGANFFGFVKLSTKQCSTCNRYSLDKFKFCAHCGAEIATTGARAKTKGGLSQKGTCQRCGLFSTLTGDQKLKPHLPIKLWSLLSGECSGTNQLPIELDCSYVEFTIQPIQSELDEIRKEIRKIISNETNCVLKSCWTSGGEVQKEFILTPENKHVWRFETDCSDIKAAIKTYNNRAAYLLEGLAGEREAYITWQRSRIEDWKNMPLLTTKDMDQIKALNRERTDSIRRSKRSSRKTFREFADVPECYGNVGDTDSIVSYELKTGLEECFYVGKKILLNHAKAIYNGPPVRKEVRDFDEFLKLFTSDWIRIPNFECLRCDKKLYARFGELWCLNTNEYTSESKVKVEALAIVSRAFRRGTKIVHIHTTDWNDVTSWEDAYTLVRSEWVDLRGFYCGDCKAPLELFWGDLRCECQEFSENKEEIRRYENSIIEKVLEDTQNPESYMRRQKVAQAAGINVIVPAMSAEESSNNLDAEKSLFELAPKDWSSFESWLASVGRCNVP